MLEFFISFFNCKLCYYILQRLTFTLQISNKKWIFLCNATKWDVLLFVTLRYVRKEVGKSWQNYNIGFFYLYENICKIPTCAVLMINSIFDKVHLCRRCLITCIIWCVVGRPQCMLCLCKGGNFFYILGSSWDKSLVKLHRFFST